MEQKTYLTHHGIQGQKWGKRNGPPYPLDYNDHSAAEKKNLGRYELTGNYRTDKGILSATYNEAKYAKAASLKSKQDSLKSNIGEFRNLRTKQSERANENYKYFSQKYQRQSEEFVKRYGKDFGSKYSIHDIDQMTAEQGKKFIDGHGKLQSGLLGAFIAGPLGAAIGVSLQNNANKALYEEYLTDINRD